MALRDEILAKVAADRSEGRDVTPIMEEYLLLIADAIEPAAKPAAPAEPAPQQ